MCHFSFQNSVNLNHIGMDDVLILAPTRWKLREAIRVLNQTFNELELVKNQGKTLIGRISRGFDFLGYHFGSEKITLAEKTIINFLIKVLQLYEQEPARTKTKRFGEYVSRWINWA